MNLIVFLGSGVSIPSGLPDVTEITRRILEEKWFNHTDENFYKGEHRSEYFRPHNLVFHLQSFLKYLKTLCDQYFAEHKVNTTNYEELYYICQQLKDESSGEILNPVIQPFAELVKRQIDDLIKKPILNVHNPDLNFFARKSCRLIECVVWDALSTTKQSVGFSLLRDLINNERFDSVDIATLNHDLLVENYLVNSKVDFVDGFTAPEGDVRFFAPEVFSDSECKVKLLKLHGSTNWFRYPKKISESNRTIKITRYGVPIHNDFEHCKDENGKLYGLTPDGKPVFLTGSYNKLFDYNFGIIRSVQNKFDNFLSKTNCIVMSGYGWNDRGINGKLFEWLLSSFEKKLILLHRTPVESIKEKSKSAMRHRYDKLIEEGRLIPIKKWFSETSLDEILKVLD